MFAAIKKIIPVGFKYPFWYVFKAPQRKFGIGSIGRDLLGILRYYFAQFYKPSPLKTISICIGIKDRTFELQTYVLKSLKYIANPELVELCIFDCGSEDSATLSTIIQANTTVKLKFHATQMNFERAYALNQAAVMAENECLFFTDVDFEIPKNIVELVNKYTQFNSMWFPIVFYLYKDKDKTISKKNGEWMIWGGKGLFACYKKTFFEVGRLDEHFKSWGGEDEAFWLNCHASKKIIIRNKEKSLMHQWHPSFNEKYRKLAQAH